MVRFKRSEELRDKRRVLDWMGRCRKALIDEYRELVPFGRRKQSLSKVVKAIDELATDLTGNAQFYHEPGTSPNGAQSRWYDEGSK